MACLTTKWLVFLSLFVTLHAFPFGLQDVEEFLEYLNRRKYTSNSKLGVYASLDDSDPEINMPTPDLLRHRGYPAETHQVITADNYILNLHRIKHGRNESSANVSSEGKPVVFLQHGLLCSSADWVIGPVDKGLGYMLADRGYDVWMGNARGNTYSRRHVFLKETDQEYWDFSWDQMGYYDIPAALRYVMNTTGQGNITYIGHSMGTTMFWAAMETHPELNRHIKLAIGLGPVASVGHMKSPIKLLTPFVNQLQLIFKWLGTRAFLPSGKFLRLIEKYFCDQSRAQETMCESLMFVITGSDTTNFNSSLIPIIGGHTPAGTSTKTVVHYAQEHNTQSFVRYDWGPRENMERYGQTYPPRYNLSRVTAPVVLFWGDNDWLADPTDVAWLAARLGNLIKSIRVNVKSWNHLDFLWAVNVDQILYHRVLEYVAEYQ